MQNGVENSENENKICVRSTKYKIDRIVQLPTTQHRIQHIQLNQREKIPKIPKIPK